MRGNGIEHTTTSTGTGALSLSAASGKPAYDDVFGTTGTRLVSYTVLDSADVPIEGGIGTITLSTLSLARTKIDWTWDGTTYTNNGAALSLASGTKKVICSLYSDGFLPALPFVATSIGDNLGASPLYVSGTNVAANFTNQRVEYFPVFIMRPGNVTKASVRITAAYTGGSSSLNIALYEVASDGRPGVRIADFGNLGNLTSATTLTSAALGSPVFLNTGWAFVGMLGQFSGGSGTPSYASTSVSIAPTPLGASLGTASSTRWLTVARVTGQTALNDPATLTSVTGVSTPNVLIVSFGN
jgi:hypothetical protein